MPRVNINISDELKEYFEKRAKETGATQSSLMSICLAEYVDMKKSMSNINHVAEMLKVKSQLEESDSKEKEIK